MPIVEFKNVSRIYVSGDHEQKALDKVSFSLDEGKFVVILGPSGAGKSTLLNLLGGLDSRQREKFMFPVRIFPPSQTMSLRTTAPLPLGLFFSFTTWCLLLRLKKM